MGYLLLFSFILHFIGFYFLIILYQRQKVQKPFEKERVMREMEDILVAYTTEMKENNERLAKIVTRERRTPSAHVVSSDQHKDIKRKKIETEKNPPHQIRAPIMKEQKKSNRVEAPINAEFDDYSPPLPNNETQKVETSPTSKVLLLYKQGLSEKEIAKQLNMGHGEIELMIKMSKKLM